VLYDPELHEPLTDEAWDEGRVRDAIGRIAADADTAFDPERLWPAEEWDVYLATPPLKDLYVGASGVIWALDALRRRGLAETAIDLPAAAARTLELWRELPNYERRGHAERIDNPADGRSFLIRLTAEGRAVLNKARPRFRSYAESVEARLGSRKTAALRASLVELREAIDEEVAVRSPEPARR
jgi:hypothetical protein